MIEKDSFEVERYAGLLSRIQQVVPGLTGPVGNLWQCEYNGYVGIEMVYDQEPPTAMLREFRPGHYGLIVLCLPHSNHNDDTSAPIWEVSDYGCGVWLVPTTDSDEGLIKALQV